MHFVVLSLFFSEQVCMRGHYDAAGLQETNRKQSDREERDLPSVGSRPTRLQQPRLG